MQFPSIIQELLSCPGLLRLRDVRMANNQFVAFPSFASASRYEHSLGVCYLAGLCAISLKLPDKDAIELMMACLYHDIGTPPFAHAMEEVLQARFGFDHEQNLTNLILGTTGEFDREMTTIFFNKELKLRSVCHSKAGRALGLDLYRIAKIAAGDKDEILSPLLNSNGMDLDNIDNIIRASSAMGLIPLEDINLASRLSKAFVLDNNMIYYDGNYINDIRRWQQIRDIQYTAIFDSIDDFSYQTMIKKALNLLILDNASSSIVRNYWKYTDSDIAHVMLASPKTKEIMRRIMICQPYHCLGILYVQGNGVSKYINANLDRIETVASNYYDKIKNNTMLGQKKWVVANFYPDKRKRKLQNKALSWNMEMVIDKSEDIPQSALLGLFTPNTNKYYRNVVEIDGSITRKSFTFCKENLIELIQILKGDILKNYDVSIYGSDINEQSTTNITGNQLGFFRLY